MSKEKYIKGIENEDIFLRIWDDVHEPKGLVQIFHGMAEHSGRYDDFALFLNKKGYIVYGDDHRGHGNSKGDKVLGYTGHDGFNSIVEEEKIISGLMKESHPDLPLYIFAHSFGSFIGQEYIIRYSDYINGIILSGSAKQNGLDVKAAYLLASLQKVFLNDSLEARLLDKLSFGSYNNKIDNRRTKFDWLTRDEGQVDKYILDDLCGYISPINFYHNLFSGFKDLYKRDRLKKISKDLPILVLSGDMDPVGKYGNSVKALHRQYVDLGLKDIGLKLYEGGRHEMLNEVNKEEVYDDILAWMDGR